MLFENSREQTMPFYKSKFWEYPEVNDVPKARARPTINGLVLISGHKWLTGVRMTTCCLVSVCKAWIAPFSTLSYFLINRDSFEQFKVTQDSPTDDEAKLMGAVAFAFYCWRKRVCTTDLFFFITSFINNFILRHTSGSFAQHSSLIFTRARGTNLIPRTFINLREIFNGWEF